MCVVSLGASWPDPSLMAPHPSCALPRPTWLRCSTCCVSRYTPGSSADASSPASAARGARRLRRSRANRFLQKGQEFSISAHLAMPAGGRGAGLGLGECKLAACEEERRSIRLAQDRHDGEHSRQISSNLMVSCVHP